MRALIPHLFVALAELFVVGEGFNYRWGTLACIMTVIYGICTFVQGFRHGKHSIY